jgi:hypothetical protein
MVSLFRRDFHFVKHCTEYDKDNLSDKNLHRTERRPTIGPRYNSMQKYVIHTPGWRPCVQEKQAIYDRQETKAEN